MKYNMLKYGLIVFGLCTACLIALNLYGYNQFVEFRDLHKSEMDKLKNQIQQIAPVHDSHVEMETAITAIREDVQYVQKHQVLDQKINTNKHLLCAHEHICNSRQHIVELDEVSMDLARNSVIQQVLLEIAHKKINILTACKKIAFVISERDKKIFQSKAQFDKEEAEEAEAVRQLQSEVEKALTEREKLEAEYRAK